MDNSPIPKGILKTLQSKTAKRKLIQEGLLRQVTLGNTSTSPITFKVLVFGGNNCGKSTLCRALSGGSPLVQSVDGRGTINSPNETSTLGIETTTVLIASFRGRPVYLHLWEIPYDLVLAATISNNSNPAKNTLEDSSLKSSISQLDIAFFGAHGCILILDARDTTKESAKAVDTTRDIIQRMLSGSSRVFSDNTDYLAKMLNLHSLPPISGLGSNMMEQDKKLLQFPIYLLAHKADHPAAFVAACGEFGKDEHSPGIHFADSQFERTHGQINNGYPPSWYTRHPRHDIEGVSSFKYALGMSPDEIGNYARLAGFRGWWWTSSLPSILGADQININIKKTNVILNNLPKKVKNSYENTVSRSNNTIVNTPVSLPINDVDDKQGKSFFSGLFGFGTSSETGGTLNKGSQGLTTLTQAIPQLLDNISASYVSTFPSINSDGSSDKSESTAPLTSLQVVFASIVDDCLEFYNFLEDSNAFAVGDDKNIHNNDLIIFF